jgi:hypothetical protein
MRRTPQAAGENTSFFSMAKRGGTVGVSDLLGLMSRGVRQIAGAGGYGTGGWNSVSLLSLP